MAQLLISDFVAKLMYLEEAVGARATYKTLEPFRFQPRDPIQLQSAAKHIAQFLGLEGLVFIISFVVQESNIGGHVELQDDSPDVFVEISPEMAEFPEAVLATLSHELTHKYLHRHRLYRSYAKSDELDNEILTDVAAVYLGLGKLMVNGCEVRQSSTERDINGTHTITRTYRSGYLDRHQFSFIYKLVCSMRRLGDDACFAGISEPSRSAITSVTRNYKNFFQRAFAHPEYRSESEGQLTSTIGHLEIRIRNIETQVDYLEDVLNRYLRAFVLKSKKNLANCSKADRDGPENGVYNPVMRYLSAAMAEMETESRAVDIENLLTAAGSYVDCLSAMVEALHRFDAAFPDFPDGPVLEEEPKNRQKSLLSRLWSKS